MEEPTTQIRKAIRRQDSEKYILITLLAFAASVSLTRLFLELTGYPQIGNSELHIAHVLWGGLLLFVSALLPLLFANRWVYSSAAMLAGIGVGLFIDEVGKFITQSNDYFYPAAAPIIYAVFMLTVLLYINTRRPRSANTRVDFYYILQDLEEVLDHDLSEEERLRIRQRLERIMEQENHPDITRLAIAIEDYISCSSLYLAPHKPDSLERMWNRYTVIEERWLTRRRFKALLAGGLAGWGFWAVSYPARILSQSRSPHEMEALIVNLLNNRLVNSITGLNIFSARIGLEGSIGLLILLAMLLFLAGKDQRAVNLAYGSLLVSLSIVNPLLFYFDQFSTIANASIQFLLLLGVLRFRKRFLNPADTA